MKMITAAIAAVVLASSPAAAKDWWTTTQRVGSAFAPCDHETRDGDPGENMAQNGGLILRNAVAAPRFERFVMGGGAGEGSFVRFSFPEGPDVIFAYATTAEACEAVRAGKIPIIE